MQRMFSVRIISKVTLPFSTYLFVPPAPVTQAILIGNLLPGRNAQLDINQTNGRSFRPTLYASSSAETTLSTIASNTHPRQGSVPKTLVVPGRYQKLRFLLRQNDAIAPHKNKRNVHPVGSSRGAQDPGIRRSRPSRLPARP